MNEAYDAAIRIIAKVLQDAGAPEHDAVDMAKAVMWDLVTSGLDVVQKPTR